MKTAPTLTRSLRYIPGRAGTRSQAQRELKAFKALFTAARLVPGDWNSPPLARLDRALTRIENLSE